MRTLEQLAIEANAVQNACNIIGSSASFGEAMLDLYRALEEEGRYQGTAQVNNHPIAVCWADKMASLAGVQNLGDDRVLDAMTAVDRLAAGKETLATKWLWTRRRGEGACPIVFSCSLPHREVRIAQDESDRTKWRIDRYDFVWVAIDAVRYPSPEDAAAALVACAEEKGW